jgi:L-amino acid N-acyltransferase YncA
MAKITETKVPTSKKIESSGNYRVTGNPDLTKLIIMIHATSIRNGNELVNVICEKYKGNLKLFKNEKFKNIGQFSHFVEDNKQGFIVNKLKIQIRRIDISRKLVLNMFYYLYR